MATFGSAPISEVVKRTAPAPTSERSLIAQAFRQALQERIDAHEALIVAYGEDESPMTIRNRLYAAGKFLGHEADLVIKKVRNEDKFVAFLLADQDATLAQPEVVGELTSIEGEQEAAMSGRAKRRRKNRLTTHRTVAA